MDYSTGKVNFSSTNNYGSGPDEDDIYTVEEFIECCDMCGFIDYDGHGYAVDKDGYCIKNNDQKDWWGEWYLVIPSQRENIPKEATHIIWFNK